MSMFLKLLFQYAVVHKDSMFIKQLFLMYSYRAYSESNNTL